MILHINGVRVACFLDWIIEVLKTPKGRMIVVVCVVLAIISAVMADRWDRKDEEKKYEWHN